SQREPRSSPSVVGAGGSTGAAGGAVLLRSDAVLDGVLGASPEAFMTHGSTGPVRGGDATWLRPSGPRPVAERRSAAAGAEAAPPTGPSTQGPEMRLTLRGGRRVKERRWWRDGSLASWPWGGQGPPPRYTIPSAGVTCPDILRHGRH